VPVLPFGPQYQGPGLSGPSIPRAQPNGPAEGLAKISDAFGHAAGVLQERDNTDARIYRAKKNAEIHAKLITGLAEKQNSGEDLTGLKGWAETQTNSLYEQAMKDAPNDTARQLLSVDSVESAADFGVQGLKAEAEYKVAKRLGDIEDTLTLSANNLVSDPASFAKVYAQNKALIDSTPMPIQARQKAEDKLKQLGESALSGMIQSNPGGALDTLKSGQWDKYLDAGSRVSLQARAENEIEQRAAQARAEANRRQMSDQIAAVNARLTIQDDLASIKETGQGIEGFSPDVVAQTVGGKTGLALATDYAAKRAAAIEYHAATSGLDELPNDQVLIRAADAEANLPKPGEPGYAAAVVTAKAVETKAKAVITARQEDPAAAVSRNPAVMQATKEVDRAKPETVQALVAARIQAQRAFTPEGAERPLTKVELTDLVAPLRNVPPSDEQFYKTIDSLTATIRNTYGEYAPAVLRQMATRGGLGLEASQAFADEIYRGAPTARGGKTLDVNADIARGENAMSIDAQVSAAADELNKVANVPTFKMINFLKGNANDPEIIRQFDEKFGPGAAEAILKAKAK